MLTLTEAAKEVGLSRPAIFNAIKRGSLSATKDAQGRFIIDPAELFRVYKPINNVAVNNDMVSLTEVNHLNQLLSMKDQLLGEHAKPGEAAKQPFSVFHHSPPESRYTSLETFVPIRR